MPANGRWDLIQRLKVNQLTNYLTACSRFLPENLTAWQLVKKIPKLNGTSKFKAMSKIAHTCPCSESHPNHFRPCHSLSLIANFIPSHQCTDLPSCLFASGFLTKHSTLLISTISHIQLSLSSLCITYAVLRTWPAQKHTKCSRSSGKLSTTVFPKHFCSQTPFGVKK